MLAAAACGAQTSGAGAPTSPPQAQERVKVVTTLYPLEYFAKRIAGNTADVVNLVAPGVESHDFEPTPNDIRTLDSAQVVIYNGAGFEPWIENALQSLSPGQRVVVEASRGLAHIESNEEDEEEHAEEEEEHEHGPTDPHVWLDPLNAAEQVKMVRDALVQANPEASATYQANADALVAELEALHQRFADGLSSCRHATFVTSHSAFSYLAERYGLEQVSISGITPEAEPSPRDLAALTTTIRDLGVRYIMMEVIVSPALAETVARETGAELLLLHPLESLTPEEASRGETYFSIMEQNLESLRTALECS